MTEKLVTIAEYNFLPEAETLRMHLESAGIQAFLADAETVAMDWALGAALGYIKLQVPQSQAESAKRVLEEIRAKRKEESESRPKDKKGMACLSCGARMTIDQRACPECGWSYEGDDEDNGDEVDGDQPLPEDSEPDAQEAEANLAEPSDGWTEDLRSLKGPLLMLLIVGPFIAGFVLFFLRFMQ